jgi:hypothetical protein
LQTPLLHRFDAQSLPAPHGLMLGHGLHAGDAHRPLTQFFEPQSLSPPQ